MQNKWTQFIYSGGQVPTLDLPKIKTPVLTDMKQIRVETVSQSQNIKVKVIQ